MAKKVKRVGPPGASKPPSRRSAEADDLLTSSIVTEQRAPAGLESLGDRLNSARSARGLTLADLSSRTGIAVDTLQRVESNEMIPPLSELIRLGKALDTRLGYFISPGADKPATVVRAGERRPVSRYGKRRSERYGYFYESLAPEKANRSMEPFIVTLTPTDSEELSTHDGQEFLFVLEGRMRARIGDQVEELGPGDALYYDSIHPHSVRCVGGEARILAVIYTKTD